MSQAICSVGKRREVGCFSAFLWWVFMQIFT